MNGEPMNGEPIEESGDRFEALMDIAEWLEEVASTMDARENRCKSCGMRKHTNRVEALAKEQLKAMAEKTKVLAVKLRQSSIDADHTPTLEE